MSRDLAALDGRCPATRGRQVCASIGLHARHVWVDPDGTRPETGPAAPSGHERAPEAPPGTPSPAQGRTGPPAELVEAVRHAVHDTWCQPHCHVPGHDTEPLDDAQARAAITAVRAWDASHATQPRPGVPPCPGHVWDATTDDRTARGCTQPLGYHGGCR